MSTIPHVNLGKKALLDWANDFFQLGYTRIEECANGALYCQVMDCLFPGRVPLGRVNFNARLEHEFVSNYKVLQTALTNEKIDKYVDVERLCRAKFQDNLEFLQWVKGLFDHYYDGQPYDAAGRRRDAASKNPLAARREALASNLQAPPARAAAASTTTAATTTPATAAAAASRASPNPVPKARAGAATAALSSAAPVPRARATGPSRVSPSTRNAPGVRSTAGTGGVSGAGVGGSSSVGSSPAGSRVEAQLRQRIAELERSLAAETNRREQLAFQQAFYYAKLREVELICLNQKLPFDDNMRQTLLDVMYKPDHDPALEPEDEGLDAAGEPERESESAQANDESFTHQTQETKTAERRASSQKAPQQVQELVPSQNDPHEDELDAEAQAEHQDNYVDEQTSEQDPSMVRQDSANYPSESEGNVVQGSEGNALLSESGNSGPDEF